MATFNFYGDNKGTQNIAGQDMYITERGAAIGLLTNLLGKTRDAIVSGELAQDPGADAAAGISTAIDTLRQPDPGAPQRARMSLARAREILTTAALVPALADAITRAIEAIRGLG